MWKDVKENISMIREMENSYKKKYPNKAKGITVFLNVKQVKTE